MTDRVSMSAARWRIARGIYEVGALKMQDAAQDCGSEAPAMPWESLTDAQKVAFLRQADELMAGKTLAAWCKSMAAGNRTAGET